MWRLRHRQPPRILRGSAAGRSDLISYIKRHSPCGPSVTSVRLLPLPSTTSFGYSLQFDLLLWTPRCSTPLKFGINLNDLMIWRPIIPSPSSGGNSALLIVPTGYGGSSSLQMVVKQWMQRLQILIYIHQGIRAFVTIIPFSEPLKQAVHPCSKGTASLQALSTFLQCSCRIIKGTIKFPYI